MNDIVTLRGIVDAIKSIIPDTEWVLRYLESTGGWLRFPPPLIQAITNLRIENYPLLYEDEKLIWGWILQSLFSANELAEIAAGLEIASPDERSTFLKELLSAVEPVLQKIPKTPAELKEAERYFNSLNETGKMEAIKSSQAFYSFFFASLGQTFSMVIHGEKLTSLVAQAKANDDEAFVKAVQIDRRILTVVPYFRDRYARAQQECDVKFCKQLAYRLAAPPYRGKIRHKSLWMAFAILDQAGFLNTLSHPEILAICDEAGVGGHNNRIADVGYLGKRIREYRQFQARGIASTP